MIDQETAKSLVQGLFVKIPAFARRNFVLFKDIREFRYGWVFFYNTKKFIETNDILDMVFEVEPIVVDKYDQSIHFIPSKFGTYDYIGDYLQEYETQRTQWIRWYLRRRWSKSRLHALIHGPLSEKELAILRLIATSEGQWSSRKIEAQLWNPKLPASPPVLTVLKELQSLEIVRRRIFRNAWQLTDRGVAIIIRHVEYQQKNKRAEEK